jgi:type I restriction enzyme S subunit
MEYFDWLSRSRDMYHRAYRSSYGVHIEKMTFNLDLFLTEKISFPSNIAEQRKIATVLSAADREIDQLIQKLDAYKQQKKGLMQQLLTGKKRVGIAKSEVA